VSGSACDGAYEKNGSQIDGDGNGDGNGDHARRAQIAGARNGGMKMQHDDVDTAVRGVNVSVP
jgi:hypothetical protein